MRDKLREYENSKNHLDRMNEERLKKAKKTSHMDEAQ